MIILCEKENNELVYQNPVFGSCYLHTTGVDNNDYSEFENLFILSYDNKYKVVNLKMDGNNRSRSVFISNIIGSVISQNQIYSDYFSFSFRDYPPGLYIITVLEEEKFMSKKFIIN